MVPGTTKGGGKYCALYASVDCGNGKLVILLGTVSLAPAHPASVGHSILDFWQFELHDNVLRPNLHPTSLLRVDSYLGADFDRCCDLGSLQSPP